MTDRRQLLWGGRSTALHCPREKLPPHPVDSLWFIKLEGLCCFWLGTDAKPTLSISEAMIFSRDDAIRALALITAGLGPVAVAADPLLADLHRIIERAHRTRVRATAAIAADIESEPDLFDRRNFRHESLA